jgi:hypothetical protein
METQDWEGKQLDKDLKVLGNMVYSPDTCLFISPDLNRFLNENHNSRGEFPIGVYLKSEGRYGCICGKKYHGYFDTILDSHLQWISEKIKYIDEFIETSDNDVKIALENFKSVLQYHLENSIIFEGRKNESN